ncbi:class I SAM-dependent methyltransferase [Planktomarina temperata]|nr:class I SAM-dependent methyltransferase [Planktomarina temperata]
MKCRHCHSSTVLKFLDLANQPLSNAYLSTGQLSQPENTYPLRLCVCDNCFLVQTEDYTTADEVFNNEYPYFSSTSKGWLLHAKAYVEMVTKRFELTQESHVIEIASNDGYLLKNFVAAGIPCTGIEPTASTAQAAISIGVPTIQRFFDDKFAAQLVKSEQRADLIIGNNVFAHVPQINNFSDGIALALKPDGVVTLEFPHLMKMVEFCQFDTAYHEHFSYLSLTVIRKIFKRAGLRIFDVEELDTHGGSLRVFGCLEKAIHVTSDRVTTLLHQETSRGMDTMSYYSGFQEQAVTIKNNLLRFLLKAKEENKTVAAYGAAAKGNTILNFAGIKSDLLPVVYDASDAKQNKFLPGSHIPILSPKDLIHNRPDYLLILPWNISAEIQSQLTILSSQGTKFVTAVPELKVF